MIDERGMPSTVIAGFRLDGERGRDRGCNWQQLGKCYN